MNQGLYFVTTDPSSPFTPSHHSHDDYGESDDEGFLLPKFSDSISSNKKSRKAILIMELLMTKHCLRAKPSNSISNDKKSGVAI